MPAVQRGDRRIHHGVEGSGPGIVLVPGIGSGAKLFGTLPRRFARSGFTCSAIDPVGLEPSSPLPDGRFDFDAAADDLLAVAATLPAPVALVGTSFGGKVALRAAVRRPGAVHRLVLLGSAAAVSERARRVHRMFELLAGEVDGALLGELLAPFLFGATFLRQRKDVVDDIVRSMRPTPQGRAFMAAQAQALRQYDGSDDARACRVPTLCLGGAEDTLAPPDEVVATAALIPGARHRILASAGHSLLLESAAAFDEVVAFVRS
jgi:pimeloyl-ACP methyl ester carboxylesterase